MASPASPLDTSSALAEAASPRYALALHGGAGAAPALLDDAAQTLYRDALAAALRVGQTWLAAGGTSLDCVEQVVRTLEDDPLFNAGRGAVLNAEGECELDAAIMDGRSRACGAVAAVRTVKNPVVLARRVMEQCPHVLLAAAGAERFAAQIGVEQVASEYFRTPARVAAWEKLRGGVAPEVLRDSQLGTVGCVALDAFGNLAAATSTGGLLMKQFGRIGDTPLIGAGTFADNGSCAVSCTGRGEQFIRHVVAYDIAARMTYRGQPLAVAVREVIEQQLLPGDGGVIAVDRGGAIVMEFNTPGMYRAAADSSGRWEIGLAR